MIRFKRFLEEGIKIIKIAAISTLCLQRRYSAKTRLVLSTVAVTRIIGVLGSFVVLFVVIVVVFAQYHFPGVGKVVCRRPSV